VPGKRHLVIGANGFVGRRLVAALAERGLPVRGLVRREAAKQVVSERGGEPVVADLLKPDTLDAAFDDVAVAYYLVHSMRAGRDFAALDACAVDNAVRAAERAGVARIVHIGGLLACVTAPTRHLRSRYQVERRIRESGIDWTVFRASILLGRGGASFEVMRDVVRNMPVIPMLEWRRTLTQPIAISDVLAYLLLAADTDAARCRAFDIGAPKPATYEAMLHTIQSVLGTHHLMVRFPGYWPRLSEVALRFVTSVPNPIVRELIPGLRYDTLCRDDSVLSVFPVRPKSVTKALVDALAE
jgi:uncharacterized protein YbjT (DUF2867 family)